jgi:hypothetical protein
MKHAWKQKLCFLSKLQRITTQIIAHLLSKIVGECLGEAGTLGRDGEALREEDQQHNIWKKKLSY